ncbi:hypothetical protein THRCLA_01543 [Thraustotheca clavata]|uniref:Myb-like domain-containing protein n=1 Tax=Thraustotheca clavata TaxID=74557 RepID=A0A1W0A8S8_9STRA|nr:hypothetical protein THRCLA_01543 [Thraustotheca clavata]
MADVADILGVSGAVRPTIKKEEKPKPKSKIHRELWLLQEHNPSQGVGLALGGRSHVSSVPSTTLPTKKSLLANKSTQRVKWVRREFTNVARTDNLVLSHWVKASMPEGLEYPFARFNVTCEVTPCCTKDEFDKVLKDYVDTSIPQPWTLEETIKLWDLCKMYQLRWIVVTDRYNLPPRDKYPLRSMEDIKYWYYEVTRLLIDLRREPTALEATESTTEEAADQVAQETTEGKAEATQNNEIKVEPNATTQAESSSVQPPAKNTPPAYRFHISHEKQRKAQLEISFNRSSAEESAISKLQDELRSIESQLKKAVVRVDMKKKKEMADVRHHIIHPAMPPGVYFRSTTQTIPAGAAKMGLSGKLVRKMNLVLEELHVPPRPMPTKQVCALYDTVRQDALGLLALKKALAVKATEVYTLSAKYEHITGQLYEPRTLLHPVPYEGKGDTIDGTIENHTPLIPGIGKTASQKGGSTLKRKAAAAVSKRPSKKLA